MKLSDIVSSSPDRIPVIVRHSAWNERKYITFQKEPGKKLVLCNLMTFRVMPITVVEFESDGWEVCQ